MADSPAATLKMGGKSALWRRWAYRAFDGWFFVRRCRTPDGVFDTYVSPGCQLNTLDPRGLTIDPVHQRFIERWVKPSDVIWDVGGNMGLFAFPAALRARTGRVYVFEPDLDLARYLERSARRSLNADLAFTVISTALSDADGAAEFLIARYGRSMNKLYGVGDWHEEIFSASDRRTVPTLRIDTLARVFEKPTIIKIDEEGGEMKVLAGARETIKVARPIILIEGPRELWDEMKAYFSDLDYIFMDGQATHCAPIEMPVWDTIALPCELWDRQSQGSSEGP